MTYPFSSEDDGKSARMRVMISFCKNIRLINLLAAKFVKWRNKRSSRIDNDDVVVLVTFSCKVRCPRNTY